MLKERPAKSVNYTDMLAFVSFGEVPEQVMGLTVNQRLPLFAHGDGGSNPPLSANLITAPLVVRATSGAILRPKPKNEVVTPIVILAHRLEESKDQNDVPQLRDRDGKGREIWEESNSAIPMQTVREAVQRASRPALGLCTAPTGEGEYDPSLSRGREQRERHGPAL